MPKPKRKGAGKAAKPKPKLSAKPVPMIWNPRLRQANLRLKNLEEEKAKLEQRISQLEAKKAQKVEEQSHEGEFDGSSVSSSASGSSRQSAIHGGGSDVSSLGSRAHPLEEDPRKPKPAASRTVYTSDISVMTEDIYHYDVRGRRVTDDDYGFVGDTETTAAWHQDVSGRAHNYSGTKQKASKRDSEPRVWIEWKRGRTYKPDANLAFDAAIHMHPTDMSLLVADDKSFFDELSFSSGDDTFLKAAVTDMPMEIDMCLGADDQSVNSALHSECSISVAPLPSKSMYVKSVRREPDLKQDARSAAAQFLYRRGGSEDGSTTTTNTNSKRRRRRGQLSGEEDSPPPLTEDMSLVDERDLANGVNEPTKDPPFEISISDNKSEGSMESLGSQLGGASVAPTPQKSRSKKASAAHNRIATPTESANHKKNDRKKGKKSKQSAQKNNNMLGKRESWTEENELSARVLTFDAKVTERSKEDKEATRSPTRTTTDANSNGKYKSPANRTRTKKTSNTAKKRNIAAPGLNNSASTLGDASGLNNEAEGPQRGTKGATGLNGEGDLAAPTRPEEVPQHNWATKGEATRLNGEADVAAPKRPAGAPQHNWTAKGGSTEVPQHNWTVKPESTGSTEVPQHKWTVKPEAASANGEASKKRPGEVPQHNWATNIKDPKGKPVRKTTEPVGVEGGALGQIIQEENEARIIPGPSEAASEPTARSGPSDEAPNKSGPSDEAPTKTPTKQPTKQSTKQPSKQTTKQTTKQPTKPMAVEGGVLGEIIEQGIESAGKGRQ